MDKSVQENILKFNAGLVDELFPKMGKQLDTRSKLIMCVIISERQARLQKQIEWLAEQKEYYRKLKEE